MSKLTTVTYVCDKCGKKSDVPIVTASIITDRVADAAGGMENVHESIDLCTTCAGVWLGYLLDNIPLPARYDLFLKLRAKVS